MWLGELDDVMGGAKGCPTQGPGRARQGKILHGWGIQKTRDRLGIFAIK